MKHFNCIFYSKLLIVIFFVGVLFSCDKNEPQNKNEIINEITSTVNAIAIDKENTKWIGTSEGLFRAVDNGFQLVDLSINGEIHSLFYDETEDLLWIGTESGLLNAVISENGIEDDKISNEKLSNPKVVSMHFDGDSKHWFGTDVGFTLNYNDKWKSDNFRVNERGDSFTMTAEDFTVNSITSFDGYYYFATSGAKLYRALGFDETVDAFTGATQWDFPYNGFAITDTMFVVFIDKDGNQWMGGKEGIQVHRGNDPKEANDFIYYYDELPDLYVLAIDQSTNGDIWVGTRKGLARFDGVSWEIITEGLPGLCVTAIAFDRDGSTWVGTNDGLAHIE